MSDTHTETTPSPYEAMLKNPSDHFDRPADVVADAGLSETQKTEILRAWDLEARQLSVATEENMDGGEAPRLSEIATALRRLSGGSGGATGASKFGV